MSGRFARGEKMIAYEELKGSSGRQIFFRPKRYDAADLFSGAPPKVWLKSAIFRLGDVSLTGVCVNANQSVDASFELGEIIPFAVKQAGLSIFEGSAKVVRAERSVFGSKVALNLVDGVVDFHSLLRRNAQARISQQLATLDPHVGGLVSQEYRAHCADVLRFLRAYQSVVEASVKPFPHQATGMSADEAYAMCEERIIPQWRSLWRAGNQLVVDVMADKKRLEAMKEYTELVLTPELNHGPVWHRSYFKPAGYPGDFEIMNYVYDWQREGANVYGQLMHRIGLDVAECIGTRMHVVRKVLSDVIHAHKGETPVRVLSLGCGSAREVELYLKDADAPQAPAVFTLIDQEANALAYAYDHAYPLTVSAKPQAKVQALNVSFTDVLRGGTWLDDAGPQDLIYSVGLIDYLIDRRARALAARLYERLAPGGLLIIGNMNDTELSNLWPMEFITDWHLYYRTEKDMLGWTEGLGHAKAWTETDPTGRVRLLFVRKTD
jgi:extracellular factor (EF) 3-hydroxypalmitic acid methyl ester biosynthesis protein